MKLLRASRPSLEVFGTCPDIYHLILLVCSIRCASVNGQYLELRGRGVLDLTGVGGSGKNVTPASGGGDGEDGRQKTTATTQASIDAMSVCSYPLLAPRC